MRRPAASDKSANFIPWIGLRPPIYVRVSSYLQDREMGGMAPAISPRFPGGRLKIFPQKLQITIHGVLAPLDPELLASEGLDLEIENMTMEPFRAHYQGLLEGIRA